MGKRNTDENEYYQSDDRTGSERIGEELDSESSYPKKEKKFKQSEVNVSSQVNWKKGFPVGRNYVQFAPYESKNLSREIVEHKDFQQQIKDFIVKEN